MAIIKCKMCGGDIQLSPDQSFGTCEYCGSTMTLPKVDDDQRAAAFNRGNHFRRLGEFDKALAVYEGIVRENENDAEAHWCCALCRFGIEYVKDPATGAYIPTCHRASFDSFLEDVDYKAALDHADAVAREQYRREGEQIAQIQRGILSISQREQPYDVFLCYKETGENGQRTVDSTLAQDIYYQLTEKGYRVFFARITLEDKAGLEYEPYIFAALHSARVMVVVGTRPEHFNAVWVKNEWSRFLALMKTDRKRLLIPCYRDMDPYDLPEQLSVLQSYDMSRIGFLQDLVRGISKVLEGEKKAEVKETVIVQGEGGANTAALLKRGQMALEDGDWNNAASYFDRVLDMDAECAEAFFGKSLANVRCANAQAWVERMIHFGQVQTEKRTACEEDMERVGAAMKQYYVPGYLSKDDIRQEFTQFDRQYDSAVSHWQRREEAMKRFFETDKLISRAARFARGDFGEKLRGYEEQILQAIRQKQEEAEEQDAASVERIKAGYAAFLTATEEKARKIHDYAVKRREEDYAAACGAMEAAGDPQGCAAAAELFERLGEYADCQERAERCRERAEQLQQEAERLAREEAERKAAARAKVRSRRKAKAKKAGIITLATLVAAIAIFIVVIRVILPNQRLSNAQSLFESGNYEEAIDAFRALDDKKLSEEKLDECYAAIIAAAQNEENAGTAVRMLRLIPETYYTDPNHLDAVYVYADKLLENEDWDEASTLCSTYMDITGEDISQYKNYAMARAAMEVEDYVSAIDAFAAIGTLDFRDTQEQLSNTYYLFVTAGDLQISLEDAVTALEAAVELANLETTAHPTAGADFVEDAEEKIAFYTGLMDCTGTYQCYQKELTDGTITTEDVGYRVTLSFYVENGYPKLVFDCSLFHDTTVYDSVVVYTYSEPYTYNTFADNSEGGIEHISFSSTEAMLDGDTFSNTYFFRK